MSMFLLLGVIQIFSHNDQEAQRLTWNHPLDLSCLLLSDRLNPPKEILNISFKYYMRQQDTCQ